MILASHAGNRGSSPLGVTTELQALADTPGKCFFLCALFIHQFRQLFLLKIIAVFPYFVELQKLTT